MSELKLCVLASVALLCAGCAVDNFGFVAGEISQGNGAWVADLYTIGGQVRTRADDPGFTFGVQRRSYVLADEDENTPAPGWYYFHVPLPKTRAIALDTRSLGLEVRVPGTEVSLSVGLRSTTLLAHLPADHNGILALRYAPAKPSDTYLAICARIVQCKDFSAALAP